MSVDCLTTVVTITHNRRRELLETLGRLTSLPERPPVIVVDNASEDGSADAVAEAFPQVRVVPAGANLGACGRTLGVRQARTPYVAFSDDDSWWAPGALYAARDLLAAHPRMGLLAARTRVGARGGYDPLHEVLARSPLGRAPDLPGPQIMGFLACAAVVRRTAYLAAGGYHPLLFVGGEEVLLAYDLAARGWSCCYCPEVLSVHQPSPDPRPGRRSVQRRNEVLTAWLRRPLPVALRRTWALAADAAGDTVARDALGGLLTRLPAALRDRQRLPAHVEAAAALVER
ncbi:glycosyltransferase family 2 protein [Actinacidiphila sp. bgisy167]|uniref:glycosyltransferase family 2 protein n=1 Tax=Actinacidiphila sp. bgisy167 TaxID=3413797 RepID=UPI003D737367